MCKCRPVIWHCLQILMAGVLLDIMRQANEQAGGIIAYQEFYNQVGEWGWGWGWGWGPGPECGEIVELIAPCRRASQGAGIFPGAQARHLSLPKSGACRCQPVYSVTEANGGK